MYQLSQYYQQRYDQPHAIMVNVIVQSRQHNTFNSQTSIDPEIPFCLFIHERKEYIDSQHFHYLDLDKFIISLGNGIYLQQNDSRTLIDLGFINGSTIYITEKQSQYTDTNKRIYKVQVDLKVKKIELFIEQFRNTPISCVFHDILVELFQNYQLKIARPLALFINGTEIEPFDIRKIQDFQTVRDIIIKSIDPNEEPNKNTFVKFQFALNKSKEIKHFSKKLIKIQLDDDIEVYDYNDISLDELILKHVQSLSNTRYFINDEILPELKKIYALNNFKLSISVQYETNIRNFYFIGDFYKQIQIKSRINGSWYYFEEYMPINTEEIEFQKYLEFKIFGPNQDNYRQELISQEDQLVINYFRIQN